jgi:hypothetical protein
MTGVVIGSSGFLPQNFLLSMGLFFNWTSRYGLTSQDLLPFFFGYKRIFSFKGVREFRCASVNQKRNYRTKRAQAII